MKFLKLASAVLLISVFTACSGGGGKKVLIMASGKLTVDEKDSKNIQIEPGTRHNEQEVILEGGDKQTITVKSPQGDKTYDLEGSGHYILNLKGDTLVGGIVKYGTGGRTASLTGEDVDRMIDSTQKLILGQNVSDASKTYFILPYSAKKISDNTESKIIGVYSNIPGTVEVDNSGKSPETYKFFTTKQKRESLEDLIKERKK